jgi:hypothetical protein
MSRVGFARISTIEQDLTLQLEALKRTSCEYIFHRKQSNVVAKMKKNYLSLFALYVKLMSL